MKNKIGNVYENLLEMQEDLEVELEGEVFFSGLKKVPFDSSIRQLEIYNDTKSYILEIVLLDSDTAINWDESPIKLVNVYD